MLIERIHLKNRLLLVACSKVMYVLLLIGTNISNQSSFIVIRKLC